MKQNYLYCRLIVMLVAILPQFSFAQEVKDKKEAQQALAQNIIAQYPQATENINYGETDIFSPRRTDGNQYLIDDDYKECIVYTRNNKVSCESCRYDIMEDKLNVFVDEDFVASMVSLAKTNIKAFELEGRTFVQFADSPYDSTAVTHDIKAGFYELIHKGAISCYVSWKKDFLAANTNAENSKFRETHKIYVQMEGEPVFKRINSKGDVLKLVPGKKKELKALIRKHHFGPKMITSAQLAMLFNDINLL